MIPKIIYFNFGFSPDFGNKPFGLIQYLAIKSAKKVNNCDVILYYQYAPVNNEWWEKVKSYCTLRHCNPPKEIFGHPLENFAYQSDVFRLSLLNEQGGIYFDGDTISINPIDSLLENSFVLGEERAYGNLIGLCNAVMLAEKNSSFGKKWIEEYKKYDPNWGVMSVYRPLLIAKENPSCITVCDQNNFFKYGWTDEGLKKVHEEINDISESYVLHLWEQKSYNKYLENLTPEIIRKKDTTYNILARTFLNDEP